MKAKDDEREKPLYSIKDPNEYIRAYRAIMAEDAGMQVDEILPFERLEPGLRHSRIFRRSMAGAVRLTFSLGEENK